MEQIAVTGGKGGTGKSTFAVLLALKLSKKQRIVLCDADVGCPNDHLILGKDLKNEKTIEAEFPEIDAEKCTKCGKCVGECRANALFMVPGKPPRLLKDLCNNCALCWKICPEKAIKPVMEECGKSYETLINENLWLVTGEATGRPEQAAEVVKTTKERAMEKAEKGDALLIIDTAAGTHCDVIHALEGTKKAYIVTEPTPLGEWDSELMVGVLEKLKIRPLFVINRAGVSDDKGIRKLAERSKAKIEHEIPYSEEIAKAYSEGKLYNLNIL